MSTDQQIGANLLRLRGAMAQKDLAERMRALGHRWSQATVWSVEKGERPLRYSEALSLTGVLEQPLHAFGQMPGPITSEAREQEARALQAAIRDREARLASKNAAMSLAISDARDEAALLDDLKAQLAMLSVPSEDHG